MLNRRGYERLRTTSCEEVNIAFCVTETFNQRNQGCSIDESVAQAQSIIADAHEDGRRVRATLAASFGCPFEGRVDSSRVVGLAGQLTEADEIAFADTIGVGVPRQVHEPGNTGGSALAEHTKYLICQRNRGHRSRRVGTGCIGRRHRRLPVLTAVVWKYRYGGSSVLARTAGRRYDGRPR